MKTSKIIWYIVIAAVVYAIIYYGYRNYKSSGSLFVYTPSPLSDEDRSAGRFATVPYISPRPILIRPNLRDCYQAFTKEICERDGGVWLGRNNACCSKLSTPVSFRR